MSLAVGTINLRMMIRSKILRTIRYVPLLLMFGLAYLFFFNHGYLYDLEKVQKDYIRHIVAVCSPRNQSDLLVNISLVAQYQSELISGQETWFDKDQQQQRQLMERFNLSDSYKKGLDLDSFKGRILNFNLNVVNKMDRILQSECLLNPIDELIDQRRLDGWRTNLKLSEFRPISRIRFGAQLCQPESLGADLAALIFVFTAPSDFKLRSLIRETWAKKFIEDKQRIRLYFAIGRSGNVLDSIIDQEYQTHRDVIQWDYQESYLRLTIKSLAIIRWAAVYCPLVAKVYKVDGDSLLNYDNFMQFVSTIDRNGPFSVYGSLFFWAKPHRFWTKFTTSIEDYPYTYYPQYADSNWLLTGMGNPLMTYVTGVMETMPALPWEDVFITGLIPERLKANGIVYEHHHFPGYADRVPASQIDRSLFEEKIIFTHHMNQYNLIEVWRRINQN